MSKHDKAPDVDFNPTTGTPNYYRWPFRNTGRGADPATKRDVKVLNWLFAVVCIGALGVCIWWLFVGR